MSPGLVAFMKARLDEDETWALASCAAERKPDWRPDHRDVFAAGGGRVAATSSANVAAHVARHDPARVLREVEADRALLAAYMQAEQARPGDSWESDYTQALGDALAFRAAAWSDHPDYRAEWAPR